MQDRWATIDRIFDEALEQPAAERRSFVGQASGGDEEVAGEVLALLRSHDEAQLILGESASGFAEPLLEAVAAEWLQAVAMERRVGPYRLLREIGEGGAASVFLARGDEQLADYVALKLMKRGLGSSEGLLRFRYERQVLAALEHPNIARLYDGGVAQDGLPYLVMEYVEGRPITAYCQAERLGLEARLSLFLIVCRAVQFAHQHLVIHGALKPSNILVTDEGTPKLLDCGITRLLGMGAPLRSRAHAAPEQIGGGPITTATDVYALGVLLYELVAGSHPLIVEPLDALEGRQAVLEQELVPPSVAATTPRRLRRRLRGDLDSIVLMALEREPGRRYQSAQELLEDVDRHLTGLPVRARRPTVGYRLGRWVRRHRIGIAAAAAFTVLIAGAAALSALRVSRDRAPVEAAAATASTELDLFKSDHGDETLGDTLDLFDLLHRASRRYSPAELSRPEALASRQRTLGRLYLELGDYPRAAPLLDSAVVLSRALYGPEDEKVALALRDAAALRQLENDYPASDQLYRQALAIQRRRLGQRHPEVGMTLNRLAGVLARSGRPDSAERLYREALGILRAAPGDERREIAIGELGLGLVERNQGKLEQAESLFRDVTELRVGLARNERDALAKLDNLGFLYLETGRPDSAEATLRESLAMRRARVGAEQEEVARGLDNLALVSLMGGGDYAAADSLWHQALAIREALHGRNDREVGRTLGDLGQLELERGNPDSALYLFAKARKVMRAVSGEESVDVARMDRFVGLALYLRGDLVGAEPELERAVELRQTLEGPSSLGLAGAALSLADALRDRRRYARADSLYARALTMWRELEGEDEGVAAGLNGWGRLRLLQGRAAEADSMLRDALAILRRRHPDTDERVAQVRADLGATQLALGRTEQAESLLVSSYPHLSPYEQPRAQAILATLYDRQGGPEHQATPAEAPSRP